MSLKEPGRVAGRDKPEDAPVTGRDDRPLDVSVVVPTHNRPALLRQTVHALALQEGVSFEVVVVDDGSAVPVTLSAGPARWREVRLLRHEAARGPAAARNAGWRASAAPLVAFTDDDCVPEPGWLQALVRALAHAPPTVGGVGGRVLPVGEGPISRYMTLHRILEPPASLSYLVTANACFHRSALEAVGGFDERVRTPGGEDPGLSFALTRAGYRLRFAESAVVRHHYRESIRDFLSTFYRYGRGCRVVLDR